METTRRFKFSNGDKVKDIVTGFTGVVTGSVYYLTGCNQHLVVAKPKKKNKKAVSVWYDDTRLLLIANNIVKAEPSFEEDPGPDAVAPGGSYQYPAT